MNEPRELERVRKETDRKGERITELLIRTPSPVRPDPLTRRSDFDRDRSSGGAKPQRGR